MPKNIFGVGFGYQGGSVEGAINGIDFLEFGVSNVPIDLHYQRLIKLSHNLYCMLGLAYEFGASGKYTSMKISDKIKQVLEDQGKHSVVADLEKTEKEFTSKAIDVSTFVLTPIGVYFKNNLVDFGVTGSFIRTAFDDGAQTGLRLNPFVQQKIKDNIGVQVGFKLDSMVDIEKIDASLNEKLTQSATFYSFYASVELGF